LLLPHLNSQLGSNVNAKLSNIDFVHLPIPKDKNFDDLALWLASILPQHPVAIIGFSLGGYIASYFACHFPDRVSRLFVIANSPCTLNELEQQQRQSTISLVNRYGYKGISDSRIEQFLGLDNRGENKTNSLALLETELPTIINKMDCELGEKEFISQIKFTSIREDLFTQLVLLYIPIVMYYSEHDSIVNTDWLNKMRDKNNAINLIKTSGSSHMLPLVKPAELAKHISEWLT
jgi:pimeloyl-ACP methyl ester carboxylesterase